MSEKAIVLTGALLAITLLAAPVVFHKPELPAKLQATPILLNGYIACTTPVMLNKPIPEQCLATDDLAEYKVLKISRHSDGTAEVVFDLLDDTTAILWVEQDALSVRSKNN